jgi:DNA-binding NarL/FixJ family response regulator
MQRARQCDQGTSDVHTRIQEMFATNCSTADSNTPICASNRFGLTPRQLQFVQNIGDGMTNKDIAIDLGISEVTVKHHLSTIFDKLGVYSRLELAMFAKHKGLIEPRPTEIAIAS